MNTPLEPILLYPGIELSYSTVTKDLRYIQHIQHKTPEHTVEINYCKSGRIVWQLKNGNHIELGPGDFCLQTIKTCADATLTFPTGHYEGLAIAINMDLWEASGLLSELLPGIEHCKTVLYEKFYIHNTSSSFAGNAQTEMIFSGFYDQPENLKLPYQKIKALELLLYLCKTDSVFNKQPTEYQSGQIEIIREIHEQLIQHMDQRITIEELSRQYLMNPTTLKLAFKSVYGTSIAAHIKKHRMEQASRLLRESNLSVAEIAQAVGYESQSKFTAAFKAFYGFLPKEYRKTVPKHPINR